MKGGGLLARQTGGSGDGIREAGGELSDAAECVVGTVVDLPVAAVEATADVAGGITRPVVKGVGDLLTGVTKSLFG